MKYTQIPSTAFKNIQLNAGILTDNFNPTTKVIGSIIGATSGGISFADSVSYIDFGDDIDNCPKNTMELKVLDSHEAKMSGTFVTVTPTMAKMLVGAADIDEEDDTHIIPRNDILTTDFQDIWFIGDYSDKNTGENAGHCAIHLMNALNTGGFKIQTGDKEKGKFAFEFTGHYSIAAQDVVPYEIYVEEGASSVTPSVYLNKHTETVNVGSTVTLTASTTPAGQTVTWTSGTTAKATVSGGTVTGVAAGSSIITASITVDGVEYTDTCTVTVKAAS